MANFTINEFGATGDGITVNTQAIQRAIDICHTQGGGMVAIPAGNYVSGSIFLKSGVHLFLEEGARLIATLDRKEIDYDHDFQLPTSGFLLGAIHACHIAISGYGAIDGQGDELMEKDDGVNEYPLLPAENRTKLCYFRDCHNVSIKDVTFQKSSEWTIHLIGCSQVRIDGINIFNNLRGANNDGIDPDCCKDVRISNCHIEGGDDAIVIKTTQKASQLYGSCEDIMVTYCSLISRGSALKIGTETYGNIRNCLFSHCIVRNSNRGLGIWVRDGAVVENVIASDLILETRMFRGGPPRGRVGDWWGKGEPIFISAGFRTEGKNPGKIRRILIQNLFAESENSLFIKGIPESRIEDITLEQLHLLVRKCSDLPGGLFDEQPPSGAVYQHLTPAFYARQIRNLVINQLRVEWGSKKSDFWSNAVYGEDIENLRLIGLAGSAARERIPVVELNRVSGFKLTEELVPSHSIIVAGQDVNGQTVFQK